MPIQTGDIRLLESDTMTDADEGGGAITGNVIVNGASNNIFEDISTIDRTYGAVKMRKLFAGIDIQSVDKYFGSHVILSKIPADNNIGINLFNTENWFDRRVEAQSRVESYRAKGANYSGFLWATQWKDSKVVTIFQNESAPVPGVGDVLYLSQYSDTEFQYIKISDLTEDVQTFTDANGVFTRKIITIEISQALNYDFVGSEMSRFDTLSPDAGIKTTVVVSASKYFSARPLQVAAVNGDLTVYADTVYSQVIPSSLKELAITDANASGDNIQILDSSTGIASFAYNAAISSNSVIYLGSPCLPGTLNIDLGNGILIDNGGQIKDGGDTVGTVNYVRGSLTFSGSSPTYSGNKIISFKPASTPIKIADSSSLSVTDANRGNIWTLTISPPPEPGSVQASFMVLGEWYDLNDNGSGALIAQEAGIGSGTINYATGTVTITTSALPDVNTSIILLWGQQANFFNRSNITPKPAEFTFQLANTGVARGTAVIVWNDGATKTASADNQGVFSGDGIGEINHATGEIKFIPDTLPLGGTTFTVNYDKGTPLEKTFNNPVLSGDFLNLDLLTSDVLPNSVEVKWGIQLPSGFDDTQNLILTPIAPTIYDTDDGAGGFNRASGTIDYANGTLSLDPRVTANVATPVYANVDSGERETRSDDIGFGEWYPKPIYIRVLNGYTYAPVIAIYPAAGSDVVVKYRVSDSATPSSENFTPGNLLVDITPEYAEDIVPNSIRFTLGGKIYVDRNGSLFFDIDPDTDAGIFAGTVSYSSGQMNITSWDTGAINSITVESLTTSLGKKPVDDIMFRVPSAPVKSLSVQIRATPIDGGGELTATSDANGHIIGTDIEGIVNHQTGVVSIRFGTWIVAAGNEGEDWYNASGLIDLSGTDYVFKPRHVYADTMFYNAVSQTFLPLDSDILGLDPVRLPQDGRVPIYADGDLVVILHDQETIGTYVNGEMVDLGRTRLAKLNIKDSAGQDLLASRYTSDLDAGTVTFDDVSGLSQPVTIKDRIEDMAVISDVQITGKLTLTKPLTHDFPIAETLVSNAVVYGDLFARTSIPFDQQSWNGLFSDVPVPPGATGQYNHFTYPFQINNASCIQERWAFVFISSNAVNVIGEGVGQILSGVSILGDIAPINPVTGAAYFNVPHEGWGDGWSAGNVMRGNTFGANAPLWVIESIGTGEVVDEDYSFCVEIRGDIDTP